MTDLQDDTLAILAEKGWDAEKDPNGTVRRLAAEIVRLREGIREHHSASGHALCWLNDVALWQLLDAGATYPHDSLPVQEEFLGQCRRYHESRLHNTPYAEPATQRTVTAKK